MREQCSYKVYAVGDASCIAVIFSDGNNYVQ